MNGNVPDDERRVRTGKSHASKTKIDERLEQLDDSDVGATLRSVYQQTVDEDIPAEMLDLLDKLT